MPGAAQAVEPASSRSDQERTFPVSVTFPPSAVTLIVLALQLPFMQVSESMGNHDSKIVDAASVD